jgi:hypothetical protein
MEGKAVTATNHTTDASYDPGIRWTSYAKDQDAFDRLPAPIRRLLDDAPYQMSAEFVLTLYRRDGLAATITEIEQSSRDYIGGHEWTPLRLSATKPGLRSSRNARRESAFLLAMNRLPSSARSARTK